eukprot:TRINITY_DN15825_c1_g1_i1.p1 TRINITY_DN15825_c1_g1~~TRINITY_DN15825_c1_g1_i1.p1  ORF type:complete len:948 (+),score=229.06 TRINITY_DN15825_c1_g1_i1:82-2925(+)
MGLMPAEGMRPSPVPGRRDRPADGRPPVVAAAGCPPADRAAPAAPHPPSEALSAGRHRPMKGAAGAVPPAVLRAELLAAEAAAADGVRSRESAHREKLRQLESDGWWAARRRQRYAEYVSRARAAESRPSVPLEPVPALAKLEGQRRGELAESELAARGVLRWRAAAGRRSSSAPQLLLSELSPGEAAQREGLAAEEAAARRPLCTTVAAAMARSAPGVVMDEEARERRLLRERCLDSSRELWLSVFSGGSREPLLLPTGPASAALAQCVPARVRRQLEAEPDEQPAGRLSPLAARHAQQPGPPQSLPVEETRRRLAIAAAARRRQREAAAARIQRAYRSLCGRREVQLRRAGRDASEDTEVMLDRDGPGWTMLLRPPSGRAPAAPRPRSSQAAGRHAVAALLQRQRQWQLHQRARWSGELLAARVAKAQWVATEAAEAALRLLQRLTLLRALQLGAAEAEGRALVQMQERCAMRAVRDCMGWLQLANTAPAARGDGEAVFAGVGAPEAKPEEDAPAAPRGWIGALIRFAHPSDVAVHYRPLGLLGRAAAEEASRERRLSIGAAILVQKACRRLLAFRSAERKRSAAEAEGRAEYEAEAVKWGATEIQRVWRGHRVRHAPGAAPAAEAVQPVSAAPAPQVRFDYDAALAEQRGQLHAAAADYADYWTSDGRSAAAGTILAARRVCPKVGRLLAAAECDGLPMPGLSYIVWAAASAAPLPERPPCRRSPRSATPPPPAAPRYPAPDREMPRPRTAARAASRARERQLLLGAERITAQETALRSTLEASQSSHAAALSAEGRRAARRFTELAESRARRLLGETARRSREAALADSPARILSLTESGRFIGQAPQWARRRSSGSVPAALSVSVLLPEVREMGDGSSGAVLKCLEGEESSILLVSMGGVTLCRVSLDWPVAADQPGAATWAPQHKILTLRLPVRFSRGGSS